MTGGWAATNTLRGMGFCEAMGEPDSELPPDRQCWESDLPREKWCYPCGDRTDALALVEAALDAAEAVGSGGPGIAREFPYLSERLDALAAALRAVREGK